MSQTDEVRERAAGLGDNPAVDTNGEAAALGPARTEPTGPKTGPGGTLESDRDPEGSDSEAPEAAPPSTTAEERQPSSPDDTRDSATAVESGTTGGESFEESAENVSEEAPDAGDGAPGDGAPGDGAPGDGAPGDGDAGGGGEDESEERSDSVSDLVQVEEAGASDPGENSFDWYVLRVQSGREDTVSNALRKKLVLTKMDHLVREIAVPKQKLTEIKEGKKKIREQKMFPGYIFLEMKLEDDLWYLIRDTSGIGDFVGSHSRPIPMPPSEVQKIVSMMEEKEEPPEVKIDLVKNDSVKIKEGPFENFDGVVEEVHPSKGMVRVMVTIFGRATPVDLEYWQVEKL